MIWFLIYVMFGIYTLTYTIAADSSIKVKTHGDAVILGGVLIAILTPMVVLAYYAGIYGDVFGYYGNPYAFVGWVALFVIGFIYNVAKEKWISVITSFVILFLFYQMNGFTQLTNIL